MCGEGGMHGKGVCVVKGGMHSGGVCVVKGGECMAKGACMVRGHVWQRGGHVWQGGMHGRACVVCIPPSTRYGLSTRGRYASYWNAFFFWLCF